MEIDIERLREDLINYYGTAISYNPQAVIDLSIVENASYQQLINIALSLNIDLSNYEINNSWHL